MAAKVAAEGISVAEIYDELPQWPESMVGVRIDNPKIKLETRRVKEAIAAENASLGGHGRIIVRPSGTEPLVRVWAAAEYDDPAVTTSVSVQALEAA